MARTGISLNRLLVRQLVAASAMACTLLITACASIPILSSGPEAETGGLPYSADVNVLALSPGFPDNGVAFAGTGIGIFRTDDGGETWRHLPAMPGTMVMDIAVSPVFAEDREIYAATAIGLFMSFDGGESWTPVQEGYFTEASSVAISPDYASDGGLVAVARANSGPTLFHSSDRGETWAPLPGGPVSDVRFLSDGTLAGVTNNRALVSEGPPAPLLRWTTVAEARSVSRGAFSPGFPEDGILFHGGAYSSHMVRTAIGEPDVELDLRLGVRDVPCRSHTYGPPRECFMPVTLSPSFAEDGAAFAWSGGRLLRSLDGGLTWDDISLPPVNGVSDIAVSPAFAEDRTVLVAGRNEVFRSTDGGESWAWQPAACRGASVGTDAMVQARYGPFEPSHHLGVVARVRAVDHEVITDTYGSRRNRWVVNEVEVLEAISDGQLDEVIRIASRDGICLAPGEEYFVFLNEDPRWEEASLADADDPHRVLGAAAPYTFRFLQGMFGIEDGLISMPEATRSLPLGQIYHGMPAEEFAEELRRVTGQQPR